MLHTNWREWRMQQHGSKYFAHNPPPPPHTHTHTHTQGWGQKVKILLFQNIVMLAYISNLIESSMQKHGSKYFARIPPPPLTLGIGSKVQNALFSEYGHVAYQIKCNDACSNMVAILYPQTPHPKPGESKCQLFQNIDMLHIKLNGITNAATW